jgi:hypothetical protein
MVTSEASATWAQKSRKKILQVLERLHFCEKSVAFLKNERVSQLFIDIV